jgi:hypothetical protein
MFKVKATGCSLCCSALWLTLFLLPHNHPSWSRQRSSLSGVACQAEWAARVRYYNTEVRSRFPLVGLVRMLKRVRRRRKHPNVSCAPPKSSGRSHWLAPAGTALLSHVSPHLSLRICWTLPYLRLSSANLEQHFLSG